jgi:hypothetical protein
MQHPVSDFHADPHLDAERLAALADEPPTAPEAAHLAACALCRREREAYVALVALTGAERTSDRPAGVYGVADGPAAAAPSGGWEALAAALRAEGLVDGDAADVRREAPAPRPFRTPRWARGARRAWAWQAPARMAAGVLVIAGAALLGRASASRTPLGPAVDTAAAPAEAFRSPDDAREVLARARRDYARAAAFLAAADPAGADSGEVVADDAELLRARLATLDALLPRVRAAARQAPEDPAVNQLYLAAYDAREAALRQLGRTLPAGEQLTGY